MLIQAFPKTENMRAVRALRAFFRSPIYPFVIAAAMAVSELFGLELAVFYFYLVCGVASLLVLDDALGIVPIAMCGYMTISAGNNPGKNGAQSAFSDGSFMIQLAFILVVAVLFFAAKLIMMLHERRRRGVPRMTLGFAALGVAYLAAGLFSEGYSARTVLFGFVQIVSLCAFYFYFYYTVNWESLDKRYFAFALTATGLGLVAETVGMYFNPGVLDAQLIQRGDLYTGWGIYNNVANLVGMCLPGCFYLAVKCRHGWIYNVLGNVMFLAILLTQSRGGILFGGVIYLACAVVVAVRSKGMERVWNLFVFTVFLASLCACLLIFREALADVFFTFLRAGADDYGRFDIYRRCWDRFLENPSFGAGFYRTPGVLLRDGTMQTVDVAPEGAFIPPRAHNTVMQLLASGGIFALAAYAFHRVETMIAFFTKPSLEKTMLFLSVADLLLTSLLDCHFFNIGPAIIYGVLLALTDGADKSAKDPADPYWLKRGKAGETPPRPRT